MEGMAGATLARFKGFDTGSLQGAHGSRDPGVYETSPWEKSNRIGFRDPAFAAAHSLSEGGYVQALPVRSPFLV